MHSYSDLILPSNIERDCYSPEPEEEVGEVNWRESVQRGCICGHEAEQPPSSPGSHSSRGISSRAQLQCVSKIWYSMLHA